MVKHSKHRTSLRKPGSPAMFKLRFPGQEIPGRLTSSKGMNSCQRHSAVGYPVVELNQSRACLVLLAALFASSFRALHYVPPLHSLQSREKYFDY